MIEPMSPTCFAKPSTNPFSVVVFVSAVEFATGKKIGLDLAIDVSFADVNNGWTVGGVIVPQVHLDR